MAAEVGRMGGDDDQVERGLGYHEVAAGAQVGLPCCIGLDRDDDLVGVGIGLESGHRRSAAEESPRHERDRHDQRPDHHGDVETGPALLAEGVESHAGHRTTAAAGQRSTGTLGA